MIYLEEFERPLSLKEQSERGRALLLQGLRDEYSILELPKIEKGEFGKPYLIKYPHIHFNISHCEKAVACIISQNEIGIDIECIKTYDQDLARFISNEEEFYNIIRHASPELAFTILWTKKESYMKFTGEGLKTRDEIKNILNGNKSIFRTLVNKCKGYVLTTCRSPIR